MDKRQRRLALAKDAAEKPRMTVRDLARLYGISPYTIHSYSAEGLRIFARQLLFLREEIEKELRDDG